MEKTSASCAKEVVDLYEQIIWKIKETGFSNEKLKSLAIAGSDTLVTKFMKTLEEFITPHWRELIKLGVEQNDQTYLHVFLSGLRKFAPNNIKEEIAEFLTLHDREIEKEFGKEFSKKVKDKTHDELLEIVEEYQEQRKCIHLLAQEGLGIKLKFMHHKTGG